MTKNVKFCNAEDVDRTIQHFVIFNAVVRFFRFFSEV